MMGIDIGKTLGVKTLLGKLFGANTNPTKWIVNKINSWDKTFVFINNKTN